MFIEVADTIDDVPFAHITDAEVAKEAGVAENQIAVFKKVRILGLCHVIRMFYCHNDFAVESPEQVNSPDIMYQGRR